MVEGPHCLSISSPPSQTVRLLSDSGHTTGETSLDIYQYSTRHLTGVTLFQVELEEGGAGVSKNQSSPARLAVIRWSPLGFSDIISYRRWPKRRNLDHNCQPSAGAQNQSENDI